MTENKITDLIAKYPKIFPGNFYFECGDGWYDLIDDLCYKLQAYVDDFDSVDQVVAGQVKEKFGGLRFYLDHGGDDCVYDLIRNAEHKSHSICEECGSPGKVKNLGRWMVCRCSDCFTRNEEIINSGSR